MATQTSPDTVIQLPPAARAGQLIDLRDRLVPDEAIAPYLTASLLTRDDDVLAARQLLAQVYLATGFIDDGDLAGDGTLGLRHDPWVESSSYYAVTRDGAPVATARQISAADVTQLPALQLAQLDAEMVADLVAQPAGAVVEISALARARRGSSADVAAIYVRMWSESLRRGHRAWVMAVDLRVLELLRNMFAGAAIRPLGPPQEYLGSTVVPAVLWCDDLPPQQLRMAQESDGANPLTVLLPRLFPAALATSPS